MIEGSGIVCVVRDITQRKRAEKELEMKTIELERSNAEVRARQRLHLLFHDLLTLCAFRGKIYE